MLVLLLAHITVTDTVLILCIAATPISPLGINTANSILFYSIIKYICDCTDIPTLKSHLQTNLFGTAFNI